MLEAQSDLFSDDVVSIEPESAMTPHFTKGKEAVMERGKQFAAMIEERHGGSCSDPVVGGNYFSLSMSLDATSEKKRRGQAIIRQSICVYEAKDGKIVKERFFY